MSDSIINNKLCQVESKGNLRSISQAIHNKRGVNVKLRTIYLKYFTTLKGIDGAIRDVAQIDIPTYVWRSVIDIFFYKGEIRRFIVIIYNFEVYTRTYY